MASKINLYLKDNKWLWVVMISIATVFALYSYFTPIAFDDLMFRNIYLEYNDGSSEFSFKALYDTACNIREYDNGRLSNILCAIAVIMVPKWLFAILTGIGFSAMYYIMLKIARIERADFTKVLVITWGASLFLLPFRNHIIICDYILNYLYPSLCILGFILILNRVEKRVLNFVPFVLSCLLSFIAAWFHEGFCVPVCFGLAVFAVYKRFGLTWQWWILCILFGLSAVFVTFAPGTFLRVGKEVNGHDLVEKIKILIFVLPAASLLFAFFIFSVINKRLRFKFKTFWTHQSNMVLVTATFVGALMIVMINSDSRAGWPSELYAMVIWLGLLSYTGMKFGRKWAIVCFAVFIGLLFFFSNLINWQRKYFIENERIATGMMESTTGTYFYDILEPYESRLSTLFLATRDIWVNCYQFKVFSDYKGYNGKEYSVVPKALEDMTLSKATQLDEDGKIFLYKNHLIGPDTVFSDGAPGWFSDEAEIKFTTQNGDIYDNHICMRLRFTGSDNNKYTYIYPIKPIQGEIAKAEYLKLN